MVLGPFGAIRGGFEVSRFSWGHLGQLWVSLGPIGDIWDSSRVTWEWLLAPLGISGVAQGLPGWSPVPTGSPWGHLRWFLVPLWFLMGTPGCLQTHLRHPWGHRAGSGTFVVSPCPSCPLPGSPSATHDVQPLVCSDSHVCPQGLGQHQDVPRHGTVWPGQGRGQRMAKPRPKPCLSLTRQTPDCQQWPRPIPKPRPPYTITSLD